MHQENHSRTRLRVISFIGPALFLLTLVVYLLTLSPGFYPGVWATTVVLHSGIGPFPSLQHPLWSALISLLARIPVGSLALKLNLMNALLASGAVWMLYSVTVRLPLYPLERPSAVDETLLSRIFAGVVAALALAFCVPFWMVATRAHPAALDLVLFLTIALFLIRLKARPSGSGLLSLFALVYGLAVTEYPALLALAPVIALIVVYALWQNGALRVGYVLLAVLSFLLGTLPYYLHAWVYSASPVAEWRGLETYFAVLWQIWRGAVYLHRPQRTPRGVAAALLHRHSSLDRHGSYGAIQCRDEPT